MEELLEKFAAGLNSPLLFGLIAVSIAVLGKAADWLVKEAVALSERSGIPKIVIGATIVSLGTTTPEAAVSVLAAVRGDASLALGNAVGSIICDTGLILGIACLIKPLPLPASILNRQGWLQLLAGLLLIVCSWPWASPWAVLETGGNLPQVAGFGFIVLLIAYMWLSAYWAKRGIDTGLLEDLETDVKTPLPLVVFKLIVAIGLVVLASHVLIPSVKEAAVRLDVPKEVIAASLVAFGTSLPELVTAITATRHGHGDLAIGNVVGADILNVLFVAGLAAAVTPAGLDASPYFFTVLFPGMMFLLIVFRLGVIFSKDHLGRRWGFVLLAGYVLVTVLSYTFVPNLPGMGEG